MNKIIHVDKDKCVSCNKCIAVCPIKFANHVDIIDGVRKIKVDEKRCISCGKCVHVCDHNARYFLDDSERFWNDLKNLCVSQKMTIIVAPAFIANKDTEYKKILGYLKSIGINLIYDVSYGADIASWAYVKYLKNKKESDFFISQPCSSIVDYIEKYTPTLIDKLMPIQSPAMCTAIYLKKYLGLTDKIAFLSPCLSKTVEVSKPSNENQIEYNISFRKLMEHIESENINLADMPEVDFDNLSSGLGINFSRPGGLTENVLYHLPNLKIKQIEGQNKVYDYLKYLSSDNYEGNYDLIDILNCPYGCNIGQASCKCDKYVKLSHNLKNELLNEQRLQNQSKREINLEEYTKLFDFFNENLNIKDFIAKYEDQSKSLMLPELSKDDIEAAFVQLRKNDKESREINCFSCGYKTCRDMAIAVFRKYDVPSSCYRFNRDELEHQKNIIEENEKYTSTILEYLTESVVVTDELGNIDFVNNKTVDIFGYEKEEYINKNIKKFIKDMDLSTIQNKLKLEYKIINKKEELLYLDIACRAIKVNDKVALIFIISDITKYKNLDALKNNFISTISHELRTPLTSIRGALGLISSGVLGELPVKMKELITIAGNNSVRLVNLVNDILDLEKIKAGKMEFYFEEYNIMSLVEEAVKLNVDYGKQYNVKFEITDSINEALVNVDKDRCIQVLTNLLSNAAKFSTPNEIVRIALERNNYSVRVSVTNKGAGIPKEYRSKMFESFSQADSSDTRNKGGSGLGLNISKSIIQKMGGNINFVSEEGVETTFYFDLPEIYSKNIQKRVLVCEDGPTSAFYIQKMFENIGYNVDIAVSAEETRKMLDLNTYELMTLDVFLPDENGLLLLNEIKNSPKTKDLPIIVISASENDYTAFNLDDKIVAWLKKSFNNADLKNTINQIMIKQKKSKVSVLHVENNEDLLDIIASTLEDYANVTKVSNLFYAERIVKEFVFDIIILDYKFQEEDCENLVHIIKNSSNKNAKLVLFSAYEIHSSLSKMFDLVLCKTKVSNDEFIKCLEPFIDKNNTLKGSKK